MKNLYFLILLLSAFKVSRAQNWQCIQPGKKVYFINSAGYLRGMRIDSVKAGGGETVFYPFHSPRGKYLNNRQLDANGAGWLGGEIIARNDGIALFGNAYNDTVRIITTAGIGSKWVFYNDTTNIYYEATIAGLDTMTIEQSLDSIKTISLMAMTGGNVVTGDSINNLQLVLSKNHGFVRIFDLYNFPYKEGGQLWQRGLDYFMDLIHPSNQITASSALFTRVDFKNPLRENLYDFAVGNVYQYTLASSGNGGLPNSMRMERIIGRQPSGNGFILTVARINSIWEIYQSRPRNTLNYDTINSTITNGVRYLVDTALMPEETGNGYEYWYTPSGSANCTNAAIYRYATTDIIDDHVNTFEPCGTSEAYQIGFGRIGYTHCIDPSGIGETETLTYALRNGTPCGQYVALAIGEQERPPKQLVVYPNPATNRLMIKTGGTFAGNHSADIEVYNLMGSVVYRERLTSGTLTIDVSKWPEGHYLLKYNGTDGTESRNIIIAH